MSNVMAALAKQKKTLLWFCGSMLFSGLGILILTQPAVAQSLTLDLGTDEEGTTSGRIIQMLALLTVLSLAPSILIMMTSFTRIIVVLSFLRTAIGLQQTPPNSGGSPQCQDRCQPSFSNHAKLSSMLDTLRIGVSALAFTVSSLDGWAWPTTPLRSGGRNSHRTRVRLPRTTGRTGCSPADPARASAPS